MNRGDVVIAAEKGEFTGKPRPYVIVQRQTSIIDSLTVTICPITTGLLGVGPIRVPVFPDGINDLREASEVEVNWVTTIRKRAGRHIAGQLEGSVLARIDVALRRWLDL